MSDPRKMIHVHVDSNPKELDAAYATASELDLPTLELDNLLTAEQLISLVRRNKRYKRSRHWDHLMEAIVNHPAAPGAVHDYILSSINDLNTWNAIATSGNATRNTLEVIATSKARGTRDHARFALLSLSLNDANLAEFERLLDRHAGSGIDDAAVRAFLASHTKTPIAIVEKLSCDSVGFVRQAALSRLSKSVNGNQ